MKIKCALIGFLIWVIPMGCVAEKKVTNSDYAERNKRSKMELKSICHGLTYLDKYSVLLSKCDSFFAISIYAFNDIADFIVFNDSGENISTRKWPDCENFCNSRFDIPVKEFSKIIKQKPTVQKISINGGYGCGAGWGFVVIDNKYCFNIPCGFSKNDDEFVFRMDAKNEYTNEYRFKIPDKMSLRIVVTQYGNKCYNDISFKSYAIK